MLERPGGRDYAQHVIEDLSAVSESRPGSQLTELFSPPMMRIVLLGVILAVLQQWCGINVIFNYAQEVFAAAGYQVSDILFNIVVTGAVNVIFTFVAFFTIDRFGRRFLLLTGLCGLVLIYTVLGLLYRLHLQGKPMLVLVLAAIACYAMSLAPVTWVLIAEIFPNRIRISAMAISVTALWTACFLLTYTFPLLNAVLGAAGTFWTYAAVCMAGAVYLSIGWMKPRAELLNNLKAN